MLWKVTALQTRRHTESCDRKQARAFYGRHERTRAQRTFAFHADLETFLEATVLTLITMMLVNGTVSTGAASVRQVSPDRSLEEALAAFARQLAVVLAGTLVAAHHAFHAGRRRKSARDVTGALSVLMTSAVVVVVVVVAAAVAVVNGNGHLLNEVRGAEHRRHGRSCAAVRDRWRVDL